MENAFSDYGHPIEVLSKKTNAFQDTTPPARKAKFDKLTPIEDLAGMQPFDNIIAKDIERLSVEHPNIYGMIGSAVHTTRQVGDFVVDIIPGLKYARPEDRQRYLSMDKQHQVRAGLYEVLGAELWVGAEVLMGMKIGKLARTPIEDTQLWKAFSYETAIAEKMAAKGHTAEVTELATSFLTGETTAVHPRVISLTKGMDEASLLRDHVFKNFTTPLRGAGSTQSKVKSIYQSYANKVFGKEAAAGMSIKNATADELKGFAGGWYAEAAPAAVSKTGEAYIFKGAHEFAGDLKWPFTSFYPVRYIFGDGEKAWGTYSQVYEPLVKATGEKNVYLSKKLHDWHQILKDRGLGVFKANGKFKPNPSLTGKAENQAHKIINQFDDMMGKATKMEPADIMAARAEIKARIGAIGEDKPIVRALIDAHYDYMDKLYAERLIWKAQDVAAKSGLSREGSARVGVWAEKWTDDINTAFLSKNGWSADQKVKLVTTAIEDLKVSLIAPGDSLIADTRVALSKSLTYGSDELFPYLENYAPRLMKREGQINTQIFERLKTKGNPSYAKERSLQEAVSRPDDFESMRYIRTNAQAREMYYNEALEGVSQYASNLPDTYKEFISHYIARLHGVSSPLDHQIASRLQGVVPGLDARRIYNATKVINDFTYMGILGFKPFSAMRNLFQVPIMVPADLGKGLVSGWRNMAKGYASLTDDAVRATLDSYGIVTDYGPELMRRSHVFGIAKNIKGFNIPRMDFIRDAAMFMFSKADQINRYVTGGAALKQWEAGVLKGAGKISKIMVETGANKRTPWIRDKIRDLISRGHMEEAQATFVKDVVADTQFLYGNLDSPIVSQTMGSIGRQAAVFQSWWMNYGTALEKWMRTGKGPGGSVERMLTWTASNFMVGTMMVPIWGKNTAMKSILLGPFSGVNRGVTDPAGAAGMVPAWAPVAKTVGLATAAGQLLVGGKTENVGRQAKALVKSVVKFAPGGSFSQQLLAASKTDKGITFDTIIGAHR